MAATGGPRATFDVAFVCTGNRYRSVLAEAAFREAATGLPVRVRSFGTLELGPAGPLPEALEAARGFGLDIASHTARCVRGADLSGASLVLGFETSHLAAAVADAGADPARTFMLGHLAALLGAVDVPEESDALERAEALIRQAAALRRESSGVPEEIADPIGKPAARQAAIGRQVYETATRLAAQLFGRSTLGTTAVAG